RVVDALIQQPNPETKPSNPDVALRGSGASLISGIRNASRLDEHQLDLALGIRLVLDSFRHDIHFACGEFDCSVAKVDSQCAIEDDEGFIRVFMAMPYEVAFQANNLELVFVHLRAALRLPLLAEQAELLFEIDRSTLH